MKQERKTMRDYEELIQELRTFIYVPAVLQAADVIEELCKSKWISVEDALPECEQGAEVGNIEWIICGTVYAGCFGRGGKFRDAYFRTWTDGTEGVDAKDVEYWRLVQIPEPPKENDK